MNELLAQAYGTGQFADAGIEKTAEAALLDELEKVAAEEGVDLSELTDDDIVDILAEAMGDSIEKTAAEQDVPDEQVKLAEADFLGRTMAHAFYQEMQAIQGGGLEKYASEDAFEAAALAEAEAILAAAASRVEGYEAQEKTSSVQGFLAEKLAEATGHDEDYTESNALLTRAFEILDANDYDVEVIADLISE